MATSTTATFFVPAADKKIHTLTLVYNPSTTATFFCRQGCAVERFNCVMSPIVLKLPNIKLVLTRRQ